jgi:hypothetical protein
MKHATPSGLLFGNERPVIARWLHAPRGYPISLYFPVNYPVYILESGTAEVVDTFSIGAKNPDWKPWHYHLLFEEGFKRNLKNPRFKGIREEYTFEIKLTAEIELSIIEMNDGFIDCYEGTSMNGSDYMRGKFLRLDDLLDQEIRRQLAGRLLVDPREDFKGENS